MDKKANNFQIPKVQTQFCLALAFFFFTKFNLALLAKVLIAYKKACNMEIVFCTQFFGKAILVTKSNKYFNLIIHKKNVNCRADSN